IEGTLKQISEQLIKSHNRGVLMDPRFSFTEKRLREEACYAIKAIRDQLKGTSVRIESEEKDFGGNILTIDTSEGRMTVRGRIDRIDTMTGGEGVEYLRVVDYKTSEKDFDLFDVLFGVNIQLVVYLMAAISFYKAGGRDMTPAGGFYFKVKLQYVNAGEKDIEGKRLDDYKMNGFMLASDDALSSMDAGEGKIISINMQRNALEPDPDTGAPVGEKALSSEEMETVFEYVRKLLKQAISSMYGGKVRPDPFFDGEKVSCEHCDYRSICRFDPEDARRGALRKQIGKKEIIKAMKEAITEGEEAEV
ncbi:MAG: PD-(D/E)XK nuclease family protein, partial [Clostridia bacterium]|nr:PD-(D/E)XK nuclease family protein [Clostridia bacterium]